jgi:hypothetical protein
MNWRRGLFRLWIVGTALFVLAIAFISYSVIKQQFEQTSLQQYLEARGDEVIVPVLCGEVRDIAGTDYSTREGRNPGPLGCLFQAEPVRQLLVRDVEVATTLP